MIIGLYNLEPKYINIALEKIELYHLQKGDKVEKYLQVAKYTYDKIYCSSIFSFTPKPNTKGMITGGTGFDFKYDLNGKLIQVGNLSLLPPQIERINPKLNIGFTSRGCIRKCEFCVVPHKEGKFRVTGDIYDLWDRRSKEITLFDNNILADKKHFIKICSQIRENKLKVDFNQGLDIRLLDEETVQILKATSTKMYRFSWDLNIDLKRKFEWVHNKLGQCLVYVIVGYNSTFKEDLNKLNILKSIGHRAYCMRYEKVREEEKYIKLAKWVNQPEHFATCSFEEFLERIKEDKGYNKGKSIRLL